MCGLRMHREQRTLQRERENDKEKESVCVSVREREKLMCVCLTEAYISYSIHALKGMTCCHSSVVQSRSLTVHKVHITSQ